VGGGPTDTWSYRQFCPLAKALEVVGERWTLLVVRELALSPRRYSEVERGIPGISAAVLAGRLRRLEDVGVIERQELPPPAAGTMYRLTRSGRDLARSMVPLAAWGTRWLDTREPDEAFRPAWPLLYLQATIEPQRIDGVKETYEMHVDDFVVSVTVAAGRLTLEEGVSAAAPDVTLTCGSETFIAIGLGRLDPSEALGTGSLVAVGDPEAVARSAALLKGMVRQS